MNTDVLLVAVDPAAHADTLVLDASTLASRLGARLVLLHVLPLPAAIDPDVLRNPQAHPVSARTLREREQEALPALRTLVATARQAGVPTSLRVGFGDPVDVILEAAADVDAGLVLLGTHGRRGLARMTLGSVAEAVVRTSPVPVLTFRIVGDRDLASVHHHEVAVDDV